ncbi:hypothetical protein M3Y99_00737500 [Aphelenchoides fujianensis]|nr:hypothetical protein M3Y99_00737500 [Aphelenchoides fujianensis]
MSVPKEPMEVDGGAVLEWELENIAEKFRMAREMDWITSGEIVSFTATQKVANFTFDASDYGDWENGTLNFAIRGYRLEGKPPALHLNDGPYGDVLERRFDDPHYANIQVVAGSRVFHQPE